MHKMRKRFWSIAIGVLAVAAALPAAAQSFRCGSKLASVGESTAAVQMKCGEPMSKEYNETTCSVGIGSASCRSVVTWAYNPGSGQFLQLLYFEGGKLVAIKQGDRVP